jgi:ABC-type transport system substrate-binding protein
VDPFPFDPEKARELLAEAGYKTTANPQGKAPETFIVNAINATSLPLVPEAAQLVASMWEEHLGIDVEVRVEERIALKKAEGSGNLAGQVYFRDNETRLDALGNMKSNYADPERTHRRQNDPEVNAWIDEIVSITDPAKQAAEANKLYLHLRDEQHEIGIGYVNIPWAVGSRVLSWEPRPLSLFPSGLHTITLK